MAFLPPITAQIERQLGRLSSLSNSGYALAIHIRYTRPTLLYRTYPQNWVDHYSENGFMLRDPAVMWGLGQNGMVNWSDLAANDPEGVFTAAHMHGLRNGVTYATGNATSRTISGHSRPDAGFTTEELAELAAIIDTIHQLTASFEALPKPEQDGLRRLLSDQGPP
jgi:LuxR family transcriptional regulator, quorum-sensing system regulator SdiA